MATEISELIRFEITVPLLSEGNGTNIRKGVDITQHKLSPVS